MNSRSCVETHSHHVDIRHIAHECDIVAFGQKPTAHNIKSNPGTQMADVRFRLRGGPTQVNRHFTFAQGLKFVGLARRGIKNP